MSDNQVSLQQCLTVSNGMVCYNGTIAGSVATYTCDSGYVLMGTAERMCRSDGQWEKSVSSCEIVGKTPCLYHRSGFNCKNYEFFLSLRLIDSQK